MSLKYEAEKNLLLSEKISIEKYGEAFFILTFNDDPDHSFYYSHTRDGIFLNYRGVCHIGVL